jgi:signal transduction histidine kinase
MTTRGGAPVAYGDRVASPTEPDPARPPEPNPPSPPAEPVAAGSPAGPAAAGSPAGPAAAGSPAGPAAAGSPAEPAAAGSPAGPVAAGSPPGPDATGAPVGPVAAEASVGAGPAPWRGRRGPWGEYGDPSWGRRGRGPAIGPAVGIAIIQLVGCAAAAHLNPGTRPLAGYGYALLVVGPAALVLRRRWRVTSLTVVLAATLAYYLLDYPYGPAFLALLAAVLGTVRAGYRPAAQVLCAAGYAIYVLTGRLVPEIGGFPVRRPSLGTAIGLAAWLVFVLVLAEGIRVRSERFAAIARTRAEQERARAEQQRRQASEERLRIARELHDVLGHHLSLINVQAGVGLHLMDERPEQARTSLLAIKQASAEALREVRSVLGVLRPEDEAAPRAPAPSLANLSTLVEGTTTEVIITGTARKVPAELDRAAYRIAQEALTNVRRHAGPEAAARVTIGYGLRALSIRVDDNGTGVPDGAAPAGGSGPDGGRNPDGSGPGGNGGDSNGGNGGAGNGIAGMRARAAALGGTLSAGAGPAGGFRVEASLPWGSK